MALKTLLKPYRTLAVAVAMGFATVQFGLVQVQPVEAAQGPESVADLAEQLLGSVVNISTSQRVDGNQRTPRPRIPEGLALPGLLR